MYCTIAVNSELRAEFNCSMTFSSPCIVLPSVFTILRSGQQGSCDPEHRDAARQASLGRSPKFQTHLTYAESPSRIPQDSQNRLCGAENKALTSIYARRPRWN